MHLLIFFFHVITMLWNKLAEDREGRSEDEKEKEMVQTEIKSR